MTLQIVASLTDDTRSVNYDRNTFIILATGQIFKFNELLIFLKPYVGGGLAPSSQTLGAFLIPPDRQIWPEK